jgi:hypothetical protein
MPSKRWTPNRISLRIADEYLSPITAIAAAPEH